MDTLRVAVDELDGAYDSLRGQVVYLYEGKPFTGVAYERVRDGALDEAAYLDGLQEGPRRSYFPSGQLREEDHIHREVPHGEARRWHENGQLASRRVYEYGTLVSETTWDKKGEASGRS